MRFCFPERPRWPDTFRRRFWRVVPHPFKSQPHGRNICRRCDQINTIRINRPSKGVSA